MRRVSNFEVLVLPRQVPWVAGMGSGTYLAAAKAGIPTAEIALASHMRPWVVGTVVGLFEGIAK